MHLQDAQPIRTAGLTHSRLLQGCTDRRPYAHHCVQRAPSLRRARDASSSSACVKLGVAEKSFPAPSNSRVNNSGVPCKRLGFTRGRVFKRSFLNSVCSLLSLERSLLKFSDGPGLAQSVFEDPTKIS